MNILTKTGMALSVFAMAVTPAFADLEIKNNGGSSDSDITVKQQTSERVEQSNLTVVMTGITSLGNTGNVEVKGQTGGTVTVDTGSVMQSNMVTVGGSTNTANVENECGCVETPDVLIKGNGEKSKNKVKTEYVNKKTALQFNASTVGTGITTVGKTGNNKVSKGTNGKAKLLTGDVTQMSIVGVTAPSNSLN